MKTKICLAILFAFLFALNISAGTVEYRIIEVNGSVKVPMRGKVSKFVMPTSRAISPADVGKIFIADDTNPNGAIGLANCSSSLIFAKAITGSDVQLANRSCAVQPQCTGADCRPNNIATIVVKGGNRRDEMDAFLMNGGLLAADFVTELRNSGLSNIAIQNSTLTSNLL